MAKNWTLKEAVAIITAGENKEAIQEICKRFPLAAVAIAKIGKNEGVETLMGGMPEHVTMLKIERVLKEGVEDTDAEDDEDADDTDAGETEEKDLESMTKDELYKLCVKRGIKAQKYQKPKAYYIDLLTNAGNDADTDEDSEEDADTDAEDESGDGDEVDYSTMKAPELYALCKKRGIKVEPKKKAAEYIKLLKKADEAAAEAEGDTDEDWDDEEEEAPTKPAKKTAQSAGKKAADKKPAKKAAKEEDDEDWDI